ncbi:MAG: bifunctional phosphoribosylaminoimidazolecarboxamide formyltransferase/IMP cyclohydrolase [Acidimicrobiia bacterium]|nr:bifunctional phosphoribosylaminoimidazolecarboxamide formyltransferase/IMP cyclohydrolase [Acidimicrobiia bacterium]
MRGEPTPIKRALISVWDKTGLDGFAAALVERGVKIVSSGGTARALRDADVPVTEVESVTGAPEMLGGRVKTLHPNIHGGILAVRTNPEHAADLERAGIEPFDLVVSTLYPFTEAVAKPDATDDEIVEMIDIGGVTLTRAAAKNHSDVLVVTDPGQYGAVIDAIDAEGTIPYEMRKAFARRAFAVTAAYDAAISAWMQRDDDLPETLDFSLERRAVLRYGENPHQKGALYLDASSRSWLDGMVQHGGKELSFNNIWDAEAAWRLAAEFEENAAVIVKHAIPCGVAESTTVADAYRLAFECDETSAFGGVVALNATVDAAAAAALAEIFLEVVVAPGYTDDALELLAAKKNLRALEVKGRWEPAGFDMKRISGGFVVQDFDTVSVEDWRVAGAVEPTLEQWADVKFAWKTIAHVRSNAIVLAKGRQAVGIGSGQQSRVDAAEIATRKAAGRAVGGVAASDAFFPFRDGIDAVAAAGVTAVVAPSGSIRDDEIVAAADELAIALVFTSERHFRH